jgi:hypothetical protein
MHTASIRLAACRLHLPAALACLTALMAACGGAIDADGKPAATRQAAAPSVITPLLDDEGRPSPTDPAATPSDPGAQTLARRYATAAQASQLEAALQNGVISVTVDSSPDASRAMELATLTVYGLQAAHNLDQQVPVLVRGTDLRLAAATVNRLGAEGYARVFLVVP